jgi:hypothetical protein
MFVPRWRLLILTIPLLSSSWPNTSWLQVTNHDSVMLPRFVILCIHPLLRYVPDSSRQRNPTSDTSYHVLVTRLSVKDDNWIFWSFRTLLQVIITFLLIQPLDFSMQNTTNPQSVFTSRRQATASLVICTHSLQHSDSSLFTVSLHVRWLVVHFINADLFYFFHAQRPLWLLTGGGQSVR